MKLCNTHGSTGCGTDICSDRHARWNEFKAEDAGLALQFVPLVLGFFTYKAAMVARGGLDLFSEMAAERTASEPAAESDAEPLG